MQYCHISRPAHKSTAYAADRFEVPQHKWSALKEGRRSFAVLNDCKYGIGAKGGEIGLTLLKAAAAPDFTADKGHQDFTYSVSLEEDLVQITKDSYGLNVSPICAPGRAKSRSYFEVSAENVILDTIKPAEEGQDSIVLRLYECSNSRTKCSVKWALPVKKVWLTDMLEEKKQELTIKDGCVELEFAGFEVVTLKLERG